MNYERAGERRDGGREDGYGHVDTSNWLPSGSRQRHWSSSQTASGKISLTPPSGENAINIRPQVWRIQLSS